MENRKPETKKLSMTNTKQEMLDAYHAVLKQMQEKDEAELKPEKKLEEKKQKEAVQVALALPSDGASREIADLKLEINKMLTQIADKLDDEVSKFRKIEEAVRFKEKELEELYGIEKSAVSRRAHRSTGQKAGGVRIENGGRQGAAVARHGEHPGSGGRKKSRRARLQPRNGTRQKRSGAIVSGRNSITDSSATRSWP